MGLNATVTRRADGGWDFEWDAGVSPYAIWLDGELLTTTADESYSFTLPGYNDAPPDIEIVEDGEDSESEAYPPFARVQWRGVQTAFAYVVEELIDAEWVTRATVLENASGYYSWRTGPLEDGATYQYRVKVIDLVGNPGDPLSFTLVECRNPAHPAVAFDTTSGGDVVVEEA